MITDEKGIIIHQNPSYSKITGLSTTKCIGRHLRDLEIEGIIDHSATLRAIEENREITITQEINTGATVLVSAVPIRDKNGHIKKVVNNVRDLTYLNNLETEKKKLEEENLQIQEELASLKEQTNPSLSIIASSEAMNTVLDRALKVARIDSGILIEGPSGAGKEKIVELIHYHSFRKDYPLIKVNCGAIPPALLESELFGYEPGAFTGANNKGKKGLLEAANHGTFFLDEIGEMPQELQVKLLRVIQELEITRIGGTTSIPVNVRIIAATNRDLAEMVKNGEFREDLYYRLNIIPIKIPSLAERKDDIIPLVYHFLKEINQKYGINRQFSEKALDMFYHYHWPGNVRELRNFVERTALMSANAEITSQDILSELQMYEDPSTPALDVSLFEKQSPSDPVAGALKERIESFEKHIIEETIPLFSSIRKAANALRVDQSTLVRKMQKYGIER
ncbi:sigma-54 interaction domain-containing protein [Pseudogracilibacillus auburnensis]|uniref:sigma-54 interaction domain-containing protein n=1 Tax=Pseudogracilibacillus auburnensis TaxID=1494959 RepID=UPI0027DAAC6D|nr:sigma 54-interacting transcriptional regulator [Pseudogracilibacillus auburnensis]